MADKYEFDPTMSNAANRVLGEQHVITSVNFRDYHYVIPEFAPFFAESLTLAMRYPSGQIRPLIEGKDYYLGFHFIDASSTTDHPVYGAISFLDTDTEGVLTIDYHTVGGKWTLTPAQIVEILANNLRNPRITTWEQVVNPPERFPPINHTHDIVDFKTMSDVQEAVDRVRDAILATTGGGLAAHIGNYANPHGVTKAQVGLSLVQNYAIATTVQAQAGTANNVYMTPLRVKEAITTIGGDLVSAHASRTDNPHGVTKAQVGLSDVQNYGIATTQEALNGTATNKYMTPQRTKEALDVINAAFLSHVIDKDNPHEVTKDHVGLFNLENYPIATQQEAMVGTRHDRYMTPLRTTQLVAEYVFDAMKSHTDLRNNPHGVDKVQVGLGNVQNYPVASQQEAIDGVRNDRYMTPLLVKTAVGSIGGEIGEHAFNQSNPHAVTKAQVGLGSVQNYGVATATQVLTGTATNLYVTPASLSSLRNQITANINDHATDESNPHKVSAAQIGAYTIGEVNSLLTDYLNKTGTAVDSTLWSGLTHMEYALWLANSGVPFNASTLGGRTSEEIGDDVLARAGNAFAKQYVAMGLADRRDPATPDVLYWVKIHEVDAAMVYDDSRDGVAIITGGAGRSGFDGQIGYNCVMVRSSLRGAETPTPLVNVVSMLPTPVAKPLKFGYTVDQQTQALTTWACLSAVSTSLYITEFGTSVVIDSDNSISETEPTGIVYVNPVSAFDSSAAAVQTANSASALASSANSNASSAVSAANTADTKATNAVNTANAANATANTASSTATAASNKVDALELRIVALENRLDAITIS